MPVYHMPRLIELACLMMNRIADSIQLSNQEDDVWWYCRLHRTCPGKETLSLAVAQRARPSRSTTHQVSYFCLGKCDVICNMLPFMMVFACFSMLTCAILQYYLLLSGSAQGLSWYRCLWVFISCVRCCSKGLQILHRKNDLASEDSECSMSFSMGA